MLYDLVPAKVGLVDELAQESSNFAPQTESWQGVDINVNARLRNGVTVQGGTSTGRKLNDACALKAAVPEQGTGVNGSNTSIAGGTLTNPYCRVVEPYQTQIKGLATYLIPKVGVQVSGTWSSNPGQSLAANYTVLNSVVKQSLKRDLSNSAANVSVNLIQPNTFFSDRRNNIDLRFSKILRFGRTRAQVGLDVYNATNTDVVTGFNQTFVPDGAWLTPTDIQPARYVKANVQFDF